MFTRDALLLIGHGSTVVPDAARPLLAHAEIIREFGAFGEVEVGMLLGQARRDCGFHDVAAHGCSCCSIFLDDGYFTRIAIPELVLPLIVRVHV